METLLDLQNLSVTYETAGGPMRVVRDVNLSVRKGDIVGIVGESGAGKSTLISTIMSLLPPHARVDGRVLFNGRDLYALDRESRRALRGNGLAMIFQDPFTAFNPAVPIGRQLTEFQHWRTDLDRAARHRRAEEMLERVGISAPAVRMRQFPHELSGGMRQRVGIAAALLTDPLLLIADEPTTALDATTESQIIDLLREARAMVDGSILFVTHDLGLVASFCDRVAVLYAGELVETDVVRAGFSGLRHPYSRALLACDPSLVDIGDGRFPTIPGQVPDGLSPLAGCAFAPRCGECLPECATIPPPAVVAGDGGMTRCHRVRP